MTPSSTLMQLFAGENVPKRVSQGHQVEQESGWFVFTAHLMSVQINDGGPGDACHSLKQELSDDGKAVTFSTNSGTHADWSFLIEENYDEMSVWPLIEWHAVNISMTMNNSLLCIGDIGQK